MHTVFVVGGSGYIGEMLCHQLSLRGDVSSIIALDKEPQSDFGKSLQKVTYIQSNMADDGWQEKVKAHNPTVIIHTAWQIRALYGNPKEQWRWNVHGSEMVFDFAFSTPSVSRLIYFSTASSYSARKDNRLDYYFKEEDGFRDDNYIYAHEKKVVEDILEKKYKEAGVKGKTPQVVVVRPAAITGPRGRYMRIRFGLQSALQGNLKGSIVYRLVTLLTTFVPTTKGWVRQFVHEDDVCDAITYFMTNPLKNSYEVFNLTPTGAPVFPPDMAEAVGKRMLPLPPFLIRIAFFIFWHLTRGRIPTCPGSWRFYSYPVLMSGEKLASVYTCTYGSKDAFRYTTGRYESYVPEAKRAHP